MIKLVGYKELNKVLGGISLQLSHKFLSNANFIAAKPLVKEEKLSAPEGPTGNLVDSIGAVKVSFAKAGSLGEIQVGPRRKGRYKGHAAHLVEFGTKQRQTSKGANRGIMKAEPFVEPSFEKTKDQIISGISIQIQKRLIPYIRQNVLK